MEHELGKRFNTIDGETLMNHPLEPVRFVVDSLLGQGLYLLAGSPKVGKSWLALWLAVTIAKGEPVWGNAVRQGETLYLCMEDSRRRIQNRLFSVTEDAPSQVHFCEECFRIGDGLEERIEQFVSEHPETVLILIDTLQMIRPAHRDNTYANDYGDLTVLKRIADKHNLSILLIHHLRKEKDADPFNRISGTTGLSGAVDGSFTLVEEKRGTGRATLHCVGRDIEYREIGLQRNENNVWEKRSDTLEQPELLMDETVTMVIALMADRDSFSGTPTELAEALGRGNDARLVKNLSQKLMQNSHELHKRGITFLTRRSNGKRIIELGKAASADSVGKECPLEADPVDPVDIAV